MVVNENTQKNSNYYRIENLLINAFINLSQQKHCSQISVTELCEAAKVNRTTFYKHFRGTWEIKDKISNQLIEIVNKIFNRLKEVNFKESGFVLFSQVNEELSSNYDYYMSIFKMKDSRMFATQMYARIKELLTEEEDNILPPSETSTYKIILSYVMGGIATAYYDWFKGTLKCSAEELAEVLARFVESVKTIDFMIPKEKKEED